MPTLCPLGKTNDNTWSLPGLPSANHQFSDTFTILTPVPKTGAKIVSLTEPTKKTVGRKRTGHALRPDEPDQIKKKVASAVTDSEAVIRSSPDKPGVSNLLTIHSALSGQSIGELEESYAGKGYGSLKEDLTEIISSSLRPVREKYHDLIQDKAYLKSVLAQGAAAAQKRAYRVLGKVYRKVGFPERERT